MLLNKLATWVLPCLLCICGHFYCAIFILWSASILHREVISKGHILQKEKQILFSWLDYYWYFVGAYICIPYAFVRRKFIESLEINSDTVQLVLYKYHSLISSILFMIGCILLMIKLNRGFVKY